MADIFISYAREDREYARTLAENCVARGWTVWWDRKIPVGKSFSAVIESELRAARSVIVVWSSRSVTSEWVQNEAADAAERRILIPVLVEDVRIPLEFRRIQAARLVGWKPGDNQPELDDVFSSLAALLGLPGSQAVGSVAGPAAGVRSSTPVEPAVVVPEVPSAQLGAAAATDASLLSEEPPIERPAVVATSVSDESVQDGRTSVETATSFKPDNARGFFSYRARIAIVAAVAAAGILVAVIVLRPGETRSAIRPEDAGRVHDQTNSLDLTRAQFQVGIVDGIGEKLHLVNSINNLTERDVASARLTQPDGTSVSISLSPAGAAKMKALTSANVGKQMGFVRNGDVVFHTVIDGPFSSDGLIAFSSTSEVKEFFMKLQGQASIASRANVPMTESTPALASSGAVPGTPAIVPRLTGRAAGREGLGSAQTPRATVPDLSGRTEQEARDLLAKARLKVGEITKVEANIPPGTVLKQDRTSGNQVAVGTPVGFALAIPITTIVPGLTGRATGGGGVGSAQTPRATVPDLSGRTEQEARDLLAKARLTVGEITKVEASIRPGTVLKQDRPPGSQVAVGTPVRFALAIPITAVVPDLLGRTEQAARDLLAKANLSVGAITRVEANIPPGTVLKQDRPPGSQVAVGTPVRFALAIPIIVVVPDLLGRTEQEARVLLAKARLSVGAITRVEANVPPGTVREQAITPGSRVAVGTPVGFALAIRSQ